MNCLLRILKFFMKFAFACAIVLIVIGLPGVIILSWGDEENIERCMQEFPERTYDECESAVVW